MSDPIFGYALKESGEYRAVLSSYHLEPDETFVVQLPQWVVDLSS